MFFARRRGLVSRRCFHQAPLANRPITGIRASSARVRSRRRNMFNSDNMVNDEEDTVGNDSIHQAKLSSPPPPPTSDDESTNLYQVNRRLVVKRECTDVLCLFFFFLIILSWLGLGSYVIYHTNIYAVFHPSDSYDSVCGMGNFTDRPFVYYFNGIQCAVDVEVSITSGCPTPRFCVNKCPNTTFGVAFKDIEELAPPEENAGNVAKSIAADAHGNVYLNETSTGLVAWFRKQNTFEPLICDYTVKPTISNIISLIKNNKCAGVYLRSRPVLGRCFPSMIKLSNFSLLDDVEQKPVVPLIELAKTLKAAQYNDGFIANVLFDISRTWKHITGLLIFGFILSLVTVFTIRFFCRIVLWLSIIAVVFVFGGIFAISLLQLNDIIDLFHRNGTETIPIKADNDTNIKIEVKMMNLSEVNSLLIGQAWRKKGNRIINSRTFWFIAAFISGIIFFVLALILIGLTSRVNASITLLLSASKAIGASPLTLGFPVLPFIMKLIVYGVCFLYLVIIFDAGYDHYRLPTNQPCSPLEPKHNGTCVQRPFMSFGKVVLAQLANFFMLLWLGEWIYGFGYLTLAESYSNYYWSIDKARVSKCNIFYSISVAMFYHPGSIAYGAFILSGIRFAYYIIKYVNSRVNQAHPQQTASAATAVSALPGISIAAGLWSEMWRCDWASCCLKLLEIVVRFINQNVYIMIAITGEKYCDATSSVLQLLISNPVRTLMLTSVAHFFFFLTRVFISGAVGVLAYMMFDNRLAPKIQFTELSAVWFLVLVVVILTYYISNICINVYQVAVETLFLCTLIDYRDNDGTKEKPYRMTKSIAQAFS